MPDTMTAFYEFTALSTAKSSEVNNNFDLIRGSFNPIESAGSAYIDNTNDLGSADYRWKDLHLGGDASIGGSVDIGGDILQNGATITGLNLRQARYTGTNQIINSSTVTVLSFDTKSWDDNALYDTATSRFVVTANDLGRYEVSALCQIQMTLAAARVENLAIYKNGAFYSYLELWYAEGTVTATRAREVSGIDQIDLTTTGDYIDIRTAQFCPTAQTATSYRVVLQRLS